MMIYCYCLNENIRKLQVKRQVGKSDSLMVDLSNEVTNNFNVLTLVMENRVGGRWKNAFFFSMENSCLQGEMEFHLKSIQPHFCQRIRNMILLLLVLVERNKVQSHVNATTKSHSMRKTTQNSTSMEFILEK